MNVRLLSPVSEGYLCMYICALNRSLSVSAGYRCVLYVGAVELEKLPLKKDALKKLKLPFDIKSGE